MRNFLKNLRGIELALQTIIVIAILLIVLIVLATFFLGGMESILPHLSGLSSNVTQQLPKGVQI